MSRQTISSRMRDNTQTIRVEGSLLHRIIRLTKMMRIAHLTLANIVILRFLERLLAPKMIKCFKKIGPPNSRPTLKTLNEEPTQLTCMQLNPSLLKWRIKMKTMRRSRKKKRFQLTNKFQSQCQIKHPGSIAQMMSDSISTMIKASHQVLTLITYRGRRNLLRTISHLSGCPRQKKKLKTTLTLWLEIFNDSMKNWLRPLIGRKQV